MERVTRKVLTEKRTLESRVGADRVRQGERDRKAFRQGDSKCKGPEQERLGTFRIVRKPGQSEQREEGEKE